MSKIKSPQQKKAKSLDKDRRNTYGENPAASRKGIRRGKQRSHMIERRSVRRELATVHSFEDDLAADAEARAKNVAAVRAVKAFKKKPDEPLKKAIVRRKKWRDARAGTSLLE